MGVPSVGCLLLVLLCTASAWAETVKDREGAVRKDRAAMENDARWIYNDFERGFAEARQTGKPLLVVLRCVPCLSCAGIDARVLLDPGLIPLLDEYICVRVMNANALDLSRFQFDYDLSFSTLLFNGDGTVYGRFGSWTHQKNGTDGDTAGFRRALEGGLALHRGYPANKAALLGKQGGPALYRTPVDFPTLAGKYRRDLDWDWKVVQSCVHCHQIGDAFRASYRDAGKALPEELVFPMPAPETIGVALSPDHMARIASVAPGSAAEKAGLASGDDIVRLGGEPLISIADFSWVLHRAPASGSLPAIVLRGGRETPLTLPLAEGWRSRADISRRVGTWPMRGMATGGLVLEDFPDSVREVRGLGTGTLALLVKHVGQHGKHAAAKAAGFLKDDVIIEIDGLSARMTEGEVLGHLLEKRRPGDRVKTAVLRGKERLELILPMQ